MKRKFLAVVLSLTLAVLLPTSAVFAADTPTYAAAVTPSAEIFAGAAVGYTTAAPVTFTVTSTGTGALQNLAVTLAGTNAASFTLDTSGTAPALTAAGGDTASTTFTAAPAAGLAAGSYSAEIQVTADNLSTVTSTVAFTVSDPTKLCTVSAAAAEHGTAAATYAAPASQDHPEGGTARIEEGGSASLPGGTVLTLSFIPDTGYVFAGAYFSAGSTAYDLTAAEVSDGLAKHTLTGSMELRAVFVPDPASAGDLRLTRTDGAAVTPADAAYDDSTNILTVAGSGPYRLAMAADKTGKTTTERVVIASAAGCSLTLDGVSIDVTATKGACAFRIDGGAGDVKVSLAGVNSLRSGVFCAGLQKGTGAEKNLTVTSAAGDGSTSGSLSAYAASDSVNFSGAGIGGCYYGNGANLTFAGGTVTAEAGGTGMFTGAGIGGGSGISGRSGNGANITITGGIIVARGGGSGAGIGGGHSGSGSNITVTGGTVTAIGGTEIEEYCGGAGIGGGYCGDGVGITVTGGTVTATGGGNDGSNGGGSGIGGGGSASGGDIRILGGAVTATGGGGGAGIGGGCYADISVGNILLAGGDVTARGSSPSDGSQGGDGIEAGGGKSTISGTVVLAGGTVRAAGGRYRTALPKGHAVLCAGLAAALQHSGTTLDAAAAAAAATVTNGALPDGFFDACQIAAFTGSFAQEYTVSFHAGSGSGAPASLTTTGHAALLPKTIPVLAGNTFVGWSNSHTHFKADYQPGDVILPDANVTLYAVWKVDGVTALIGGLPLQAGQKTGSELLGDLKIKTGLTELKAPDLAGTSLQGGFSAAVPDSGTSTPLPLHYSIPLPDYLGSQLFQFDPQTLSTSGQLDVSKYIKASEGSTILTLSPELLNQLTPGTYLLRANFTTGSVDLLVTLLRASAGGGSVVTAGDGGETAKQFTVTAQAGEGGGFSGGQSVKVEEGGTVKLTIVPLEGYRVADVLVDGKSVGAVTEYTLSNVTADHTVSASFARIGGSPSSGGAGGSASAPQTGDSGGALWYALLLVSAAGLAFLGISKKRESV